jgi:hypothetical protein
MSHISQGAPAAVPFRSRPRVRLVAALVLVVAVAVPLAVTFVQFWSTTGEDVTLVRNERRGIDAIRPMVDLLGELSEAQHQAVTDALVDVGELREDVGTVDAAVKRTGAAVGSQERWAELKKAIEGLMARSSDLRGQAAFNAYSEALDQTTALIVKVGDNSDLLLDPKADTYYIVDAILLRLPPVLVNNARISEMAELHAKATPGQKKLYEGRIAVARDRIATAAEGVETGLRKAFDATTSDTLGPNLLGQLDAFRSTVEPIAPSATALGLPDNTSPADLRDTLAISNRATELRRATLQLAGSSLVELDAVLSDRQGALDTQRTAVALILAVGLALAAGALWLLLPVRRERPQAPVPAVTTGPAPPGMPMSGAGALPMSGPPGSRLPALYPGTPYSASPYQGGYQAGYQAGYGGGPDPYAQPPAEPQTAAGQRDPRDAQADSELVHIGRAVSRTTRQEPNGATQ